MQLVGDGVPWKLAVPRDAGQLLNEVQVQQDQIRELEEWLNKIESIL
jgi:hypothetical protein